MSKNRRHHRRAFGSRSNGVARTDGTSAARVCVDAAITPESNHLLSASWRGDPSRLQSLLEQSTGPAASDESGQSAAAEPLVPGERWAQESGRYPQPVPQTSPLGEKCPTGDEGQGDEKDKSSAELLLRLAGKARVFRGSDGRSYAEVPLNGHREVHELRSSCFEHWLIREFRREHKGLPPMDALNRLVRALEAEASALPASDPVWVRVADASAPAARPHDAASAPSAPLTSQPGSETIIYLDLGNSSREAVEISAAGCRVVSCPPVSFWRPKGLQPLPMPRWDGSIDLLRRFLNVADDDLCLVIAWATAAMCPFGPYPILVLGGEQGSAKSTMARVLRRLVDPNVALVRALPSSQRDLMIEAHNAWALAYDNVSSIRTALCDAFCRVATGGGFSTRTLHSNDDETLFDVQRPIILSGIDDFVQRCDFADRCVFQYLLSIPDTGRRLQKAFWTEFEAEYARIFGSMLTAVSGGLRMLPKVQLPALPRMADFAQWGEAVSLGLGWEPGLFLSRYLANRREACARALDDCPLVEALREFLELGEIVGPCEGTPTQVLDELTRNTPKKITRSAQWPKNASSFSSRLRRIAPQLRTIGIYVDFDRQRTGRVIRIFSAADSSLCEALLGDADACPSQDKRDAARDAARDTISDEAAT